MIMKLAALFIFIFCFHFAEAQKRISISIDDVPNTRNYERDQFQSLLLNKLDSLQIPASIFINEGLLYKTDSVVRNFDLLNSWLAKENIIYSTD